MRLIRHALIFLFGVAAATAWASVPGWKYDASTRSARVDLRAFDPHCAEGVPQSVTVDFGRRVLEVICAGYAVDIPTFQADRVEILTGHGMAFR